MDEASANNVHETYTLRGYVQQRRMQTSHLKSIEIWGSSAAKIEAVGVIIVVEDNQRETFCAQYLQRKETKGENKPAKIVI